jgi:PAS domain S-box-containing protein
VRETAGLRRFGYPVTAAVPFPRGALKDAEAVRLVDGRGKEVSAQVTVTARWPGDGSVQWVRWELRPWHGADGEVAGIVIFRENITERRRLELDRELHGLLLANMSEGVMLVRASDATIRYANPALARMFGYAPGELDGKHVSILNRDDGKGAAQAATAAIVAQLRERGAARVEIENVRKDGTRVWIAWTNRAITDEEGTVQEV